MPRGASTEEGKGRTASPPMCRCTGETGRGDPTRRARVEQLRSPAVWAPLVALQASRLSASNHDQQFPSRRNRFIHRSLQAHGAMQGGQLMLSMTSRPGNPCGPQDRGEWEFRHGRNQLRRGLGRGVGNMFQASPHQLWAVSPMFLPQRMFLSKLTLVRIAETPVVLCTLLHSNPPNKPCPMVPPVLCKTLEREARGSLRGF